MSFGVKQNFSTIFLNPVILAVSADTV